jgi:hypothetical protein
LDHVNTFRAEQIDKILVLLSEGLGVNGIFE